MELGKLHTLVVMVELGLFVDHDKAGVLVDIYWHYKHRENELITCSCYAIQVVNNHFFDFPVWQSTW